MLWLGGGLLDHLEGGGVVVGPGEGGVHVVCGVPVLLPQQQVVTSTVHLKGRCGTVRFIIPYRYSVEHVH